MCFFFSFAQQYYYSVRVFAGQELSGVWVGWITPDYHQYDPHFDISKVRNVTVTVGDDKGNIHDRYVTYGKTPPPPKKKPVFPIEYDKHTQLVSWFFFVFTVSNAAIAILYGEGSSVAPSRPESVRRIL